MDVAIFAAYGSANPLSCRPQRDMLTITELPGVLLLMYISELLLLWEGIQTMMMLFLPTGSLTKRMKIRLLLWGKSNPDVLVDQSKLSLQ